MITLALDASCTLPACLSLQLGATVMGNVESWPVLGKIGNAGPIEVRDVNVNVNEMWK